MGLRLVPAGSVGHFSSIYFQWIKCETCFLGKIFCTLYLCTVQNNSFLSSIVSCSSWLHNRYHMRNFVFFTSYKPYTECVNVLFTTFVTAS